MARDLVNAMEQLGYLHFSVAGHDRGGRVAYRMALDYTDRIDHLAVLDILPTATVWDRADARLALAFWPWSLLSQPAPLPERLLAAAPEAIIDDALSGWGSPYRTFSPEVREAYIEAIKNPSNIHAICEEYRAAATIDREHDQADQLNEHRISCPTLALWSAGGALDNWYKEAGGPIALWQSWCSNIVSGQSIEAGHFFPEEAPKLTAELLMQFFANA
jgi:haloacetate dehalogenase